MSETWEMVSDPRLTPRVVAERVIVGGADIRSVLEIAACAANNNGLVQLT